MYLSKCIFQRGNQRLVLQGMIHVAPEKLYPILQEDLENHLKEGYKVFFEGVRGYPSLRFGASGREREIAKFFKIIFDLYPVLAAAWGFETQKTSIKYPKDAVNADIPLKEVVRLLKENGFKCGFVLHIFELRLRDKELREELRSDLAKIDPFKKPRKDFYYFLAWLFIFRKLNPIIVNYRNRIAIDVVEGYGASGNLQKIFVHYGEGHIPGMIKLLKKRGWRLVDLSKLDLDQFRAR